MWRPRRELEVEDGEGCRSREVTSPSIEVSSILHSQRRDGLRAGEIVAGQPVHAGRPQAFSYAHPEQKQITFQQFALTHFYGIGHKTAHRICARFQIHDRCRVKDLTPTQLTSITAFLSSPTTSQPVQRVLLASPNFRSEPNSITPGTRSTSTTKPNASGSTTLTNRKGGNDPLSNLKIETDLRREIRENIAHQRMIGSYVGRRHAMGLPVRGQNTQNNAKTAKKLNRIDRW